MSDAAADETIRGFLQKRGHVNTALKWRYCEFDPVTLRMTIYKVTPEKPKDDEIGVEVDLSSAVDRPLKKRRVVALHPPSRVFTEGDPLAATSKLQLPYIFQVVDAHDSKATFFVTTNSSDLSRWVDGIRKAQKHFRTRVQSHLRSVTYDELQSRLATAAAAGSKTNPVFASGAVAGADAGAEGK
mmetsp:Transcript_8614/g.27082  ORF Transcript_8614/g.27082 Transcript_8614/m.27082 type:complete len:185 (-) Transcript_8614:63-617(-)